MGIRLDHAADVESGHPVSSTSRDEVGTLPPDDSERLAAAAGRKHEALGAPLDLLGHSPEEPGIVDQEDGWHGWTSIIEAFRSLSPRERAG
jgi:hypothetical protein